VENETIIKLAVNPASGRESVKTINSGGLTPRLRTVGQGRIYGQMEKKGQWWAGKLFG